MGGPRRERRPPPVHRVSPHDSEPAIAGSTVDLGARGRHPEGRDPPSGLGFMSTRRAALPPGRADLPERSNYRMIACGLIAVAYYDRRTAKREDLELSYTAEPRRSVCVRDR